jgi:hypothetical protein
VVIPLTPPTRGCRRAIGVRQSEQLSEVAHFVVQKPAKGAGYGYNEELPA